MSEIKIFHYLRGAIRGTFGLENLRGKKIVICGMGGVGQKLLTMLCFDGPEIFFYDEIPSVVNYQAAHKACGSVQALSNGAELDADIVINLLEHKLSINHGFAFKTMDLGKIGEDPYNQGIHDFYL